MRRRVPGLQNAVLRHLAVPGLALLIGIGSAFAQSGDSRAQDPGKPAATSTADAAKDNQRKTDEFVDTTIGRSSTSSRLRLSNGVPQPIRLAQAKTVATKRHASSKDCAVMALETRAFGFKVSFFIYQV